MQLDHTNQPGEGGDMEAIAWGSTDEFVFEFVGKTITHRHTHEGTHTRSTLRTVMRMLHIVLRSGNRK